LSKYQEPVAPAAEEPFQCINCKKLVLLPTGGTEQRNHCPYCLWSLHVDFKSGDRRSACRSPMEPITVWAKPGGEWAVVHRCGTCGTLRANRISGDDNEGLLLSLALRPLSRPAFPVERMKLGQ
jgi:ribosome biogenesis GTPase